MLDSLVPLYVHFVVPGVMALYCACCAPIRVQLELLVLLGLSVSQAVKEIAAPRVLRDPQGILEALELPVRIM